MAAKVKYMKSLSVEMRDKVPVAVFGGTGAVGQQFVQLLHNHPWFELTTIASSEKSAGKKFRAAAKWIQKTPMPPAVADIVVLDASKDLDKVAKTCKIVFSALDANVAGEIEQNLAERGVAVFSNSKCHRSDANVPVLIPQINSFLMEAVRSQKTFQKNGGFIVCNANCAAAGFVVVLKPLMEQFGIEAVQVATLQSFSGAGYPGLPMWDLHDNVIPFISGEDEKLETEPLKILASLDTKKANAIVDTNFKISATAHRVCVSEGHMASLNVKLAKRPEKDDDMVAAVRKCLKDFSSTVEEHVKTLPSCPHNVLVVNDDEDRPQSKLDRDVGFGMSVTVGRIRKCPVHDVKFTCVAHNLALGAAGGSVLNAEYAVESGYIV